MNIRALAKERKTIVLYCLVIFITFSFIYLLVSVVMQVEANKLKKNEVIKNEQRIVAVEQSIISSRIDRVVSDVLYMADNFKYNSIDTDNFKVIENEWKAFSDRRRIYDQIRYIDIEGNEKIRINYFENGSVVVGEEQLQNKKDRYYFKDTIVLEEDQTYISKLDLNEENGKIEIPDKPMIRFSTPVFGNDDKIKGIVVLNYYAKNILREFEETASTSYGNMFLLNDNGYWLYNSENKDKEWAFMYEDKKDINFKNEFAKEWENINNNKIGTISTENGYYSYTNIIEDAGTLTGDIENRNKSIVLGERSWKAVSFIPKSNEKKLMIFTDIYSNIIYKVKNDKYIFLFIFITALSFAIVVTLNKMSKEKIKYFSEYDAMTGVLNRRAGFELLNKIYRDFMKGKGKVSICFSDINGLKEVNDNLGHEAGDELILTMVNQIKKNIRESDFIIRLGGDEFLIIFVDSDREQAENIWNRIHNDLRGINEMENRKYIISASHGIEEFKFNSDEYIDEIINLADEKMYNEKRIIKKDFKAIRKK